MSARPTLVHLHIPKCGGTTVSRMLKSRMLAGAPWLARDLDLTLGLPSAGALEDRLTKLAALPEDKRQRVRSLEAHCGWGLQDRVPSPTLTFTYLRDPVRRVLSVHHAVKRDGLVDASESLDDFLTRLAPPRPAWHFDNGMVRYLAGADTDILDVPTGDVTNDHLELAWERLRSLPMFGLLERFDDSASMLLEKLGWSRAIHRRSNTMSASRGIDTLSADTRDLLQSRTNLDAQLYARAQEDFERRVVDGGIAFTQRVQRFKRFNRRASRVLAPAYGVLERRADAKRDRLRGTEWTVSDRD